MSGISLGKKRWRGMEYEIILLTNTQEYYTRIQNPHDFGFALIGGVYIFYEEANWGAIKTIESFLVEQPRVMEAV